MIIEYEPELGDQKRCTQCLEWWPRDAEFFFRATREADGFNPWCKACWYEWRRRSGVPERHFLTDEQRKAASRKRWDYYHERKQRRRAQWRESKRRQRARKRAA